jgi:hypothetical protein
LVVFLVVLFGRFAGFSSKVTWKKKKKKDGYGEIYDFLMIQVNFFTCILLTPMPPGITIVIGEIATITPSGSSPT